MSDKQIDVNDPNFNPWDPENMVTSGPIGLDDRTAEIMDAKAVQGQFGAQIVLMVRPDGESKDWPCYYDAGLGAKANDSETGFIDDKGNTFVPNKNSEVGMFGLALGGAKVKNIAAIARNVNLLIGYKLHFKEVPVFKNKGTEPVMVTKKAYVNKAGIQVAAKKVQKTIRIPVSVIAYPGGVSAGASDAVDAKARDFIVKAISEAPGGKLSMADVSRTVSKLINGDPDKAGILAKVADKTFLKNSEAFKTDGLSLFL